MSTTESTRREFPSDDHPGRGRHLAGSWRSPRGGERCHQSGPDRLRRPRQRRRPQRPGLRSQRRPLALGDAFEDRAKSCRQRLINTGKGDDVTKLGNKVDLPEERVFVGLDAYKKVIDSGVNYIILATPPGFRPIHLEAAIGAGKNVFTEKPVAVDGTGIRKVLAAYEEAKKKGLGVGGRHSAPAPTRLPAS